MKKVTLMAMVLMASIMTSTAQQRQRNEGNPEQRIERQVKQLDEKLNLTEEQEKQVKAIYEEFFKQRASSNQKPQARRQEMNKKIESVLTEEQKKIYEEMKKQQMPGNRRNK